MRHISKRDKGHTQKGIEQKNISQSPFIPIMECIIKFSNRPDFGGHITTHIFYKLRKQWFDNTEDDV